LKQIFVRNLLPVKPPKRFSAGKSANCYGGAGGRDVSLPNGFLLENQLTATVVQEAGMGGVQAHPQKF